MRFVNLHASQVLPLLDTCYTDFALWVGISEYDIPTSLQAIPKAEKVVLKFVYPNDQKVWSKKIGNVQVFICHGSNRVAGFSVPIRHFRKELREIIVWLGNECRNVNTESVKNNYRLIAALLHLEADAIFIPAQ